VDDHDADDAESTARRQVRLTAASTIRPRPVRWLWDGRIPVGEITLTPGHGGIGKSTFHAWLIAQVTRGTLPGSCLGGPRPCLIAASEDS
jgi:AAA domain